MSALGLLRLRGGVPEIVELRPVVDVLDFLAIAAEWRRGSIPGPAAALMGGTALGATTLGALSVAGES
jgi:hypothetical protein